jgi:hypothetical protein
MMTCGRNFEMRLLNTNSSNGPFCVSQTQLVLKDVPQIIVGIIIMA